MVVASPFLECRFCGQAHARVTAAPGTRLLCVRCGITLARRSWLGPQAPLAFTVTALAFAVPALVLPFATVSKIGPPQSTRMIDGAVALWEHGLLLLSGWVALCATVAPLLLAVVLLVSLGARSAAPGGRLVGIASRALRALEAWAMPEVYVLAVLVSFVRIESLANVDVGPGFWCYTAMAVALMLAARGYRFEPPPAP